MSVCGKIIAPGSNFRLTFVLIPCMTRYVPERKQTVFIAPADAVCVWSERSPAVISSVVADGIMPKQPESTTGPGNQVQ